MWDMCTMWPFLRTLHQNTVLVILSIYPIITLLPLKFIENFVLNQDVSKIQSKEMSQNMRYLKIVQIKTPKDNILYS